MHRTRRTLGEWEVPGWFVAGVLLWNGVAAFPDTGSVRAPARDAAWETRLAGFHGGLIFFPDGRTIACGDAKGMIRLFDAATGKEVGSWHAHPQAVQTLAISPDGRRLASAPVGTAAPGGRAWRLWDLSSGMMPPASESFDVPEAAKGALALSFSGDGTRLAGASVLGAFIWDPAERRTLAEFPLEGKAFPPGKLSWSPDGASLAFPRMTGVLFRRLDGAPAGSLTLEARPRDALVLPGGLLVWAGDGNRVQAVDPTSGAVVRDFCRDEETIEKQIRLDDGRDRGNPATLFVSAKQMCALALSRDSLTLAAGGTDGTIRAWDLPGPGTEPILAERLGQGVLAVSVSPDGRRVAAAGAGGLMKVWDLAAAPEKGLVPPGAASAWEALAGDAAAGFEAAILRYPELLASVRVAVGRMMAEPGGGEERFRILIERLGNADLSSRDEAFGALRAEIGRADPFVREALAGGETIEWEVRERLMSLASCAESPLDIPDPDLRRMLRAIRILERSGGTEALRLLDALAGVFPSRRVQVNAREASGRLGRAAR